MEVRHWQSADLDLESQLLVTCMGRKSPNTDLGPRNLLRWGLNTRMAKKLIAEFIGTFALVFLAVGAAVAGIGAAQ